MAIELVRKPSETPNINNHDDYRMFRYATGGYNGVNEKYGNKCSYEIDGSNFKIKSGEIIIDGVQARIDASGETITVDTITGTQYYSVYCEINLSLIDNQKAQIKSTYDTVDYPTIDKGDDLTESQTGIARLELYRFTVLNGVISNVSQRFNLLTMQFVKVQDFDHSNLTQVGDYIVPKRKVLYHSDSTTYYKGFNLYNQGLNDLRLINFIVKARIMIQNMNPKYEDCYFHFNKVSLTQNANSKSNSSGDARFFDEKIIAMRMWINSSFESAAEGHKEYGLSIISYNLTDGTSEHLSFYITDIYELIE